MFIDIYYMRLSISQTHTHMMHEECSLPKLFNTLSLSCYMALYENVPKLLKICIKASKRERERKRIPPIWTSTECYNALIKRLVSFFIDSGRLLMNELFIHFLLTRLCLILLLVIMPHARFAILLVFNMMLIDLWLSVMAF
jgi:hypothetical protein